MSTKSAIRSAKLQAAPLVPATQFGTRNHKTNIPSYVFVAECPSCGAFRRHISDGLRQCGGCGQVYRAVVTATIGAPVRGVIA